MANDNLLANHVRIGIVSAIDQKGRRARVYYPDKNMVSGWLYVLRYPGMSITVVDAGEHTHTITDTYTGGGEASTDGGHTHAISMDDWMPKEKDTVLVLYIPIMNGDGFVLGVI